MPGRGACLSDAVAHAIPRDHGAGQPRRLLQVAACARRHILLACGEGGVEGKVGGGRALLRVCCYWPGMLDSGRMSSKGGLGVGIRRAEVQRALRVDDLSLWVPALLCPPLPRRCAGTLASPKMSSSATRPPMHTSSLASSCRRDTLVSSSVSGSCVTMPSAMPAGRHAGSPGKPDGAPLSLLRTGCPARLPPGAAHAQLPPPKPPPCCSHPEGGGPAHRAAPPWPCAPGARHRCRAQPARARPRGTPSACGSSR